MGYKSWKIPQVTEHPDRALEKAGYTPLLSAVLRARGLDTSEKAARFLRRDEGLLHDPMLLRDMDKAVARITQAARKREKLAVYGDYDVDGASSACLLLDYFRGRGLDCEAYIPDRLDEGYGLNAGAIDTLHEKNVSLLITVDCGITAISEAEHAKSLGMDMIITDHHECPQRLPAAMAVIDPKRPDSDYPFTELAGVSVAFKLVCALEKNSAGPLSRYADLIAAGTIADVVPLIGENRCLAHRGLEKLKNDPLPGLAALLEEAGKTPGQLSAATVGFTLAPRINAAGRLGRTETALKLLSSKSREEAREWAQTLCALNRRRQELETAVWEDAVSALSGSTPESPIVLRSESWHSGVVGIAAARLAETYGLPAVMICVDGDRGKGSCRSFGDFNLFEALSACSGYLESFGGHALAAGLTIRRENINGFRQALAEYYRRNPPSEKGALAPELLITDPAVLSMAGVESLAALEPCGCGNESPLLCMTDVLLESVIPIGGGRHLRLKVSKQGARFDCVFFSHSAQALGLEAGETADICFTPQINTFRSYRSVQLLTAGLRPAAGCHSLAF